MKNDKIPDVTAFPLDQAIKILEKQSVSYYLKKALPFRPKAGKIINKDQQPPCYRVIRQTEDKDGVVEIVIAPEATLD